MPQWPCDGAAAVEGRAIGYDAATLRKFISRFVGIAQGRGRLRKFRMRRIQDRRRRHNRSRRSALTATARRIVLAHRGPGRTFGRSNNRSIAAGAFHAGYGLASIAYSRTPKVGTGEA